MPTATVTPGTLQLFLSTFDGAHAFLYKAKLTGVDGALDGDFWSGSALHRHWTAKRDEHAALADSYSVTAMRSGDSKFEFAFPDLDGKTVTSKDERFVKEFKSNLDQLLAESPGGA